jgi:GAF domain-containing protein
MVELNSSQNGRKVLPFRQGPAMIPPKPANEQQRLATLRGYEILDTEPEAAFDDLTSLASYICQTPIALISLIDADRQWFKSKVGVSVGETSRDLAFCATAILQPELFMVPDASQDDRFAKNPLVLSEPKIRFYAGAILMTHGHALGTLCVLDRVPRTLSSEQTDALRALSRQVLAQLELRRNLGRLERALAARDRAEAEKERSLRDLKAALANVRTLEGLLPICLSCKKIQDQKGEWQPLEFYVRSHSEAKVTHKICPDCSRAISA